MAGCGAKIEVAIPKGYGYKMVDTVCGSTGIGGYPNFCEECEKLNAGRDWRREAEEAGENFDSDY